MAYVFAEGGYGAAATVIHTDPSHPDAISIPDAELLRSGTFHRVGVDLHLNGRDGQHVIVPGYFASEHPAALVGPDGGRLTADLVAQLAERAQLAAAQPTNTNDAANHFDRGAIGHVDKITGDVTVVRGGVSVTLHAGDAVYKSDVIQTGGGAAVAISFADGTAVHLAANTLMVLTSFSFDPTSNSNDALFTLTDGTFAFVGGKIAHDGTIEIATDVATMRVHEGTFGWAHHLTASEISSISAKLGSVAYAFAVVNEHGANTHGIYDLLVNDGVVGNVDDPNLISYLDSDGNLITMPLDHSRELAADLPQNLLQWLDADIATRSLQGIHGSGGATDLPSFPTAINLDQLGPTFDFDPNAGGGLFGGLLNPVNTSQPIVFVNSNNGLFIWNGFGDWDLNRLNWQAGFAPTQPIDTVIIQTGKSSYNNFYAVGSLTVDFGATLNIASGTLTVSGLTNAGLVEINSSGVDPALIVNGAVDLTGGGTIEMLGPTADNFILGVNSSASLVNVDNLIEGSGNIGAGDGHLTFVNEATVDATPLLPGDSGLLIINTGHPIANFGTFEATLTGELRINDQLFNIDLVEAVGVGSTVLIEDNSRDTGSIPGNASVNTGLIEAISGGTVTIEDSTIVNAGVNAKGAVVDGMIEAGAASQLLLSNATILRGLVTVAAGGEIQTLSGTSNLIDTSNGSRNATQPTIVNDGTVLVNDDSSLVLGSSFDIGNVGTIEVDSTGDKAELLFTEPLATLSGGGDVILEGTADVEPGPMPLVELEAVKGSRLAQNVIDGITGAGFSTVTLENVDNTISGSGSIGEGTTALTFQNDPQGTVNADLFRQEIVIDTGANTIFNAGLFEATNGGLLEIKSALDNSGTVIANEDSEVLIEADVANASGSKIVARGFASGVGFLGSPIDPISVDNSGVIAARQGGTVLFGFADITNEGASGPAPAGRIVASGEFSHVEIGDGTVNNNGVIVAKHRGTIDSYYDTVTNEADGLILATGKGSEVNFFGGSITNASGGKIVANGGADVSFQGISPTDQIIVHNSGVIAAGNGGTVSFDFSDITNEAAASKSAPVGQVVASGEFSRVEIKDSTVGNSGVIVAKHRGTIDFDDDTVTNEKDGLILATGKGSEVSFDRHYVENFGEISAEHRGEVIFEHTYVDNDKGGTIEADGQGSKVSFHHGQVDNSGLIGAEKRGEVTFTKLQVDNDHHGRIEAAGRGSVVAFDCDTVDNSGRIKAEDRGTVELRYSFVKNDGRGVIEATDEGSRVKFDDDGVLNSGRIEARDGGEVEFRESLIKNGYDGSIEAKGLGSKVKFENNGVENRGWIGAAWGGSVLIEESGIKNGSSGVITADGCGSEVKFAGDLVDNSGLIGAIYGGQLKFDDTCVDNDNTIGAAFGGTVDLDHTHVENRDGVIAALGPDATVDLDSASISGGELATAFGGLISAERGTSTFDDLTIISGSKVEVDAKLELKGTIDNSGTITVANSGELDLVDVTVNGGRIDNHHTIDVFGDDELEGGLIVTGGDMVLRNDATLRIEGTATLDGVNVDNHDGSVIVDPSAPATLSVDDGTTITGGSLLVNGNGTLDVEKGATAPYAAVLDDVKVTVDGKIVVGDTSAATLKLDDGTAVSNSGTISIKARGELDLASASIDGGLIKNGNIIKFFDVDTLENLTVVRGDMTVESGAKLHIEKTVHLDGVTVDNNGGTIIVDTPTKPVAATLLVDDGTQIAGGKLTINSAGSLDVEHGADKTVPSGAVLDGIAVKDSGKLDIGDISPGALLTLQDGATVSGAGTITVSSGSTLDVEPGAGSGATLDGVSVVIDQNGAFDVGDVTSAAFFNGNSVTGPTLSLEDGVVVSGNGVLTIQYGSTLDVEAGNGSGKHGATFDGLEVNDYTTNALNVGAGATLTLEDGAVINGNGGGTIEINSGATLDIEKGATGPGATLDGISLNNVGETDIGAGTTLTIDRVRLSGGGTVSMMSGSTITGDGSSSPVFSNFDNTISGQGTIGGGRLEVLNQGTIDAKVDGEALVIGSTLSFNNQGLLEATNGATLDIRSTIFNDNTFHPAAAGRIEAHGTNSTVELEAITVNDGFITIDAGNTLEIENGTTTLTGVDVENNGNLQIDVSPVTATLVLGTGSSIDGDITIGATGGLDISGGTFSGNAVIDDYGIFDINTALTLNDDVTIHVEQTGSFVDTGAITVADNAGVTLSGAGADFGTLDIGNNSTLTLHNANASVVDFTGSDGTLVLKEPSDFTGTLKGLTTGDIIDLAGVSPSHVSFDGTTLEINGKPASFSISGGLPAGDTFAFKDDGLGGTDLKVVQQSSFALTTSPASGLEGSSIALHLSEKLSGESLDTVVISGIPDGATLTDANGDTLVVTNGSITLTPDKLSGLSIIPANDTNFTLSFLATATDSDGYQQTAAATEDVTVNPLAPSVQWTHDSVSGAAGSSISVALSAAAGGLSGPNGDTHNSISILISGIPSGATLSDGTNSFKAGAVTSQDVSLWDLSKLTISSPDAATFTLTATVSEHDGDSPAQTSSAMVNEAVTIVPVSNVPPTVSAGATVSYTGGNAAVVLDSGLTITAPTSTLTSATVSIGTGFVAGDSLNYDNTKTFADGAVIHGSYNGSTGVLTLTEGPGSAVTPTVADFRQALQSVTYSDGNNDPTHGGGDTSRTIDWSVNDGFLSSSNVTSTLDTFHVAPTVTAGNAATYTTGNGPAVLDSALTVTDVDSGGNLVGASVQIEGFHPGDVLNFTNTNHITGQYNATTGVLTLTGPDTVADYQSALRSVTYSFTPANGDPTVGGSDPHRGITWTVNDGNSVNGTNVVSHQATPFNNDQPSIGLEQLVVWEGTYPGGGIGDLLGTIRTFAGDFAIGGTVAATGELLSIQQNTALFSLLGTLYGGNGTSNFQLPNLQGTVAVGQGFSIAHDSSILVGEQTGSDQVTLTTSNLPPQLGGAAVPIDNDQPSLGINYLITVNGVFPSSNGGDQGDDVIGEIIPYLSSGSTPPAGYLYAQGQTLPISQYAALFEVIGTTYGGDGVNTFRLPDLSVATIIGAGQSQATGKTVAFGTSSGSVTTSVGTGNLPIPTGSGTPLSNDQPTVALNYMICINGIFPSRDGGAANSDFGYLGEIMAYAGSSSELPKGWVLAEGQQMSIAQNQALFAILGTTYGGNGIAYFDLPDLVGKVVVGTGSEGGQSINPGTTYGSDTTTLTQSNLPLPTVATTTLDFAHDNATFWTGQGVDHDWQTSANWDKGAPSSTLNAVFDSSVTKATTPYAIDVSAQDTAEVNALFLNDANANLLDYGSLKVDSTVTVDAGWIVVENASNAKTANGAAMTVDGTLTIHGGTIEVAGGIKFDLSDGVGTMPGGTLTVTGDIVVDGGKLVVDAGSDNSTNDPSNLHPVPGGTLNAGSINVETGGTVELHGTVDVTGAIETSGGSLIVGPDTHFTGTDTLTFGTGGTITFNDSPGQTYVPPDISGFGPGAAHPDVVDLAGFDPTKTVLSESNSNGNLVLTATDSGTVTTLTFDHFNGALNFASDGQGGIAITDAAVTSIADNGIVDATVTAGGVQGAISASDAGASGAITTSVTPDGTGYLGHFSVQPATSQGGTASVAFAFNPDQAGVAAGQTLTQSYDVAVSEGSSAVLHQTVSVSMGGTGNDNFVFAPGIGADTILNFDVTHDTIDLSQFTNIQSLASVTTTDAHGDAVIDLGNHDSITIAGINAANLLAVQNAVHLH